MIQQFLNPNGFTLRLNIDASIERGVTMYDFCLDLEKPLSFWDGSRLLEPNRNQTSDLGSVPLVFHAVPGFGKDSWLLSYIFHDDLCNHGGLWNGMVFVKYTRAEADALLFTMIVVEAKLKKKRVQGYLVRPLIWCGVRIGAMMSWFKS
jgi:hypothetical protein